MNGRTSPGTDRFLFLALFLGDLAAGAWLWFSFWVFSGHTEAGYARVVLPAAITAALAALLGVHREGTTAMGFSRMAAFALAVAVLSYIGGRLAWIQVGGWDAVWLGAATGVVVWITRSLFLRLGGSGSQRAWELVRWTLVGLAATLAMSPFYFGGSIGAGDAHWYIVMLTDFLAQLKAGVFPVWVGQSPFAFNGAVSPIRFAPGFQYYGGAVDLLTAHALQPAAVKNLCLALSAFGGAFAAYAGLRPITGGRHWVACLLSILWITGPGVLAPVMSGDQYMTFVAMPFVPVVLHGCWRVMVLDDIWGRVWISSGLAGLWVCHPPIGLWLTVIAASLYLTNVLQRRRWRRELGLIALMGGVFLALGSLPFVSVLSLDNQLHVISVGLAAAYEIHRYFPGNFLPIKPDASGIFDYQLGYALLGILGISLLLQPFARAKAGWPFALASVLVIPFTVPVPRLTDAIWGHLPGWFVTINNVWPMQRLFLVWSALAIFTSAVVLGSTRLGAARWLHAVVIALMCCGLAWSAHEARVLVSKAFRTRINPHSTRMMEGPNNTQLGRYAYGSFASTPGYASHGYMDGWFENRLLDRATLETFLTNADAAAPGDGPAAGTSTLVAKGVFQAENIGKSTYYFLRPTLVLDPGKRYALRLEFLEKATEGTLQLTNDTMFREYLLPDSGMGIGHAGPPRAFGSLDTSGKVLPLSVLGSEPAPIKGLLITPRASRDDFAAARYWLYTYERARLPISVESWIPYRARLDAPRAAFLESPRMWLKDWSATVNGSPVTAQRSPEGLVMIPVEAGPSLVTLEYRPQWVVRAAFWVFLFSWLALCAAALGWLLNARRPQAAPA